ncbi:MAG: hypothetical protein ABH805_00855 [Candidatus Nealsonbacteria bacterium]
MEKKKIFDVTPPPQKKETEEAIFIKSKLEQKIDQPSKKITFKGKGVLIVLLLVVSIFFAARATINPKAELDVWPVKTPVNFKAEVVVAKEPGNSGEIPGELIVKENYFSEEFPATGVKEKEVKAQGIIRVYNNYSTDDQVLIAKTRFVSDQGKLFRAPDKVIVPGGHYESGKFVSGEVDILVEAGESGEEYNIGPATFSIPGFAGTPRYTDFYAKSFEPMTGGQKSNVTYVTAQDLESVESSFIERALVKNSQALINSITSPDYILVTGAVKGEIIEIDPLAQVGQEAETFSLRAKARSESLVFKKEAVEEFAKNYLLARIPSGQNLNESSFAITYSAKEVDMDQARIVLNVEILAETYPIIDEQKIKQAIIGQRPEQMTASLRTFFEVKQFQVRLWPFWVTEAPLEVNRINVNLKLD